MALVFVLYWPAGCGILHTNQPLAALQKTVKYSEFSLAER
jgi:hypothetical protein